MNSGSIYAWERPGGNVPTYRTSLGTILFPDITVETKTRSTVSRLGW